MSELRAALVGSRHALVLCNDAATTANIERELRREPHATDAVEADGADGGEGDGDGGESDDDGDDGESDGGARRSAPSVSSFHGSLTADRRAAALTAFRRAGRNSWEAADGQPAPRVLVATGRAVRGLDLHRIAHPSGAPAVPLDTVVCFDMPPDVKSYLARVGCATRGTQPPAHVTALAVGSQLSFARALLTRDAEGAAHSLHDHTLVVPHGPD
jgi:hypothetical protein